MKNALKILILGLFLLVSASMAFGQAMMTITAFSATCSSATITYTNASNPNFDDFAQITIKNLTTGQTVFSGTAQGGTNFSPYGDGSPYTINFKAQTADFTIEITVHPLTDVKNFATTTADVTCGTDEPEEPVVSSDGRFCFGPGAAPIALYSRNAGLDIYEIDGSDKGLLILRFTADDLEALPAKPEKNMIIGSSKDKKIFFYKLTSGEYQINVGPVEWTNKVHVCRFSAIPDVDAVLTSFYLK